MPFLEAKSAHAVLFLQLALSLDSSPACLLSCSKLGRSWRSRGRPFWSCSSCCSSSLSVGSCHGSITSPTSLASSAACCCLLPSCRISPSALWTCTENAPSLLFQRWPLLDCFLRSLFGFILIRLPGPGWSSSPVCLSRARSVQNMTYTTTSSACCTSLEAGGTSYDPISFSQPTIQNSAPLFKFDRGKTSRVNNAVCLKKYGGPGDNI